VGTGFLPGGKAASVHETGNIILYTFQLAKPAMKTILPKITIIIIQLELCVVYYSKEEKPVVSSR
jgi:hypothetical protein